MVLKDVCGWCGCGYLVAEDDHDLVWEPGRHHDKQCSDDACECHTRAGGQTARRVVSGS